MSIAPHGTAARYRGDLKCRCLPCRQAATTADRRTRKRRQVLGIQPRVNPAPTQRRIQALMAIGWRAIDIAERAGWRRGQSVTVLLEDHQYFLRDTAEAVKRAYDGLCMTPGPSTLTAARAKKAGWLPPLAWDDIDAGTIAATERDDTYIDHAAVERVLAGDYRIPTTPAERAVIVQRWVALGRTVNELERATGWRPSRYWSVTENRKGAA